MTADSSQSEYIIMKGTGLCAVWGHTHPFSDLFSPLSSSRSSGENVILHLSEEKGLESMGARMASRSVLMSSWPSVTWKPVYRRPACGEEKGQLRQQKSDGKNNQMSRLRCADMCRPFSRPTARCWWGKTSWPSSGSFWWAACLSTGSSSQGCSSPQSALDSDSEPPQRKTRTV